MPPVPGLALKQPTPMQAELTSMLSMPTSARIRTGGFCLPQAAPLLVYRAVAAARGMLLPSRHFVSSIFVSISQLFFFFFFFFSFFDFLGLTSSIQLIPAYTPPPQNIIILMPSSSSSSSSSHVHVGAGGRGQNYLPQLQGNLHGNQHG